MLAKIYGQPLKLLKYKHLIPLQMTHKNRIIMDYAVLFLKQEKLTHQNMKKPPQEHNQ